MEWSITILCLSGRIGSCIVAFDLIRWLVITILFMHIRGPSCILARWGGVQNIFSVNKNNGKGSIYLFLIDCVVMECQLLSTEMERWMIGNWWLGCQWEQSKNYWVYVASLLQGRGRHATHGWLTSRKSYELCCIESEISFLPPTVFFLLRKTAKIHCNISSTLNLKRLFLWTLTIIDMIPSWYLITTVYCVLNIYNICYILY